MTVTIVGAQLGDEGKGGVVDVFSDAADIIVRYQGGDNAGHTVVEDDEEYKLSLVPSGAIRGKIGVLGNGCVVNPRTLFTEIDKLQDRGLSPDVRVARRAHVILPYHRVIDGIEEDTKEDDDLAAGTTGRGIGPTYEDKAGRRGIRIGDLLDPEVLRARLEYVVPQKRELLSSVYGVDPDEIEDPENAFDIDALYEEYKSYGERLKEEGMTVNSGAFLTQAIEDGNKVMLEGAQGTSLDIDHGVYPYVTSSNPSAGAASVGTGLGVTTVGQGEVIGVIKAYLSRVGTGPLPTELGDIDEQTAGSGTTAEDEIASYIRDRGGEYGTVTGRPRRVGWIDMPMLRHATRTNGFTGIAVNHIDVLAGLETVKVGHSYTLDREEQLTMPTTTEEWGQCEPNYREFDGWDDVDWKQVSEQEYEALPENAQEYLDYISSELSVPVYAVGVGAERDETIIRKHPF